MAPRGDRRTYIWRHVDGLWKREAIRETRITSDLQGGRFEPPAGRVAFLGVQVEGVDFSRGHFEDFVTVDSQFVGCDFSRVRFKHGAMSMWGSLDSPDAPPQSTYRECVSTAPICGVEMG